MIGSNEQGSHRTSRLPSRATYSVIGSAGTRNRRMSLRWLTWGGDVLVTERLRRRESQRVRSWEKADAD
jgi:hypothetical protein